MLQCHGTPLGVQGRGTVITGRIEAGIVRIGDEIELVGINEKPTKSVVTGMSRTFLGRLLAVAVAVAVAGRWICAASSNLYDGLNE